jgi:hypothetical protein
MTDTVTHIVVWLCAVANVLGRVLLAPVAEMPGWLSATLIACVTGVVLLVVFKYTSNQRAIKRVRNDIRANLLALKLFKDSPLVTLRSQGRVFQGAFQLMLLAVVPMLVMAIPVCLMLGQIALWYQWRPLHIGEDALASLTFAPGTASTMPDAQLEPSSAFKTLVGPVRVPAESAVYWSIKAKQSGLHRLTFRLPNGTAQKELAVGDGFMRTSQKRPGWSWPEILLHPWETPFSQDSSVRSIDVQYPSRDSWTSGTDKWIAYWFVVSMVAAFVFRPWLNVSI